MPIMKEIQTSPKDTVVHLCELGVIKPAPCENELTIICMYCLAAEIVSEAEARRRLAAGGQKESG